MKTWNIVNIKSVITEHPKTSHKLSKTIREAEKVGSNSLWYKKSENIKKKNNIKNVKIKKWAHAFQSFVSSYNVEILNVFQLEL